MRAILLLSFVLGSMAACSSNGSSGTSSDGSVSAITVSPNPCGLGKTSSQQMSAQATYANGTKQDVTASAEWTSSSTSTATVDSSGNVVGVSGGTVTITAAFEGTTGSAGCLVGP
jgi:uncharacterized protein YjdB